MLTFRINFQNKKKKNETEGNCMQYYNKYSQLILNGLALENDLYFNLVNLLRKLQGTLISENLENISNFEG